MTRQDQEGDSDSSVREDFLSDCSENNLAAVARRLRQGGDISSISPELQKLKRAIIIRKVIIIPLISDRFGRLLRNCSVRKAINFFIKLKCFFNENLEHFVLYI